MATHIGIGFSQELNVTQAARDAALQAKSQINPHSVDIAIIFCTSQYCQFEAIHQIKQILSQTKIVGCSTAGIILSHTVEMRGIAILAIASQEIKFDISSIDSLSSADMRVAGNLLAKKAIAHFGKNHRSLFLILSDGSIRNSLSLVKGAQEVLGRIFPIIGGGASDYFHFKETYQFFGDQLLNDSAVGILLGGAARIGFSSRHGWKPLGKPRIATESDGPVLKTVDHKRASLLYEEYFHLSLSELKAQYPSSFLMLYPLGIYLEDEKEYLLRNVIDIREDGSFLCQGHIPENSEINFMISNKEFALEAAREAIQEIKESFLNKEPCCIIIFESLLRRKLLGQDAIREIQMIKDIFGTAIPVIGMYSYGEFFPFKSLGLSGENYTHNGTFSLLAIGS